MKTVKLTEKQIDVILKCLNAYTHELPWFRMEDERAKIRKKLLQ